MTPRALMSRIGRRWGASSGVKSALAQPDALAVMLLTIMTGLSPGGSGEVSLAFPAASWLWSAGYVAAGLIVIGGLLASRTDWEALGRIVFCGAVAVRTIAVIEVEGWGEAVVYVIFFVASAARAYVLSTSRDTIITKAIRQRDDLGDDVVSVPVVHPPGADVGVDVSPVDDDERGSP